MGGVLSYRFSSISAVQESYADDNLVYAKEPLEIPPSQVRVL